MLHVKGVILCKALAENVFCPMIHIRYHGKIGEKLGKMS